MDLLKDLILFLFDAFVWLLDFFLNDLIVPFFNYLKGLL